MVDLGVEMALENFLGFSGGLNLLGEFFFGEFSKCSRKKFLLSKLFVIGLEVFNSLRGIDLLRNGFTLFSNTFGELLSLREETVEALSL